MTRYVALSTGSEDSIETVLRTVLDRPFASYRGLVTLGSLDLFRRVADDLMLPLPFSSFARSEAELMEGEKEGEEYIFYDIDYSLDALADVRKAVSLILNGYAYSLVTCPLIKTRDSGIRDLLKETSKSERASDMVYDGKARIFSLPMNGVSSADPIVDMLVRIEGLFVSGLFDESKPILIGDVTGATSILREAVLRTMDLGMKTEGPVPPKEAFLRAKRGEASAVLSLSGNEVYFALEDEEAMIITWGLPFIRVGALIKKEERIKYWRDVRNLSEALTLASEISYREVSA